MVTQIAFPAMVKKYRLANDLTMEQLAEKIGKTKSTISKWENGIRSPKIYEIEEIATFFGVSPQKMMFGKDTSPNSTALQAPTQKVIEIDRKLKEPRHSAWISHGERLLTDQENENTVSEPLAVYDDRERVIGIVDFAASAGTGVWQDENLGMEVTFYKDDMAEDYDSIGIVMGHSMEPVLKNGDYLFVKVTTDIPNGALSIWQVNGENYVKKFRRNGKPYLESLNPEYDDITLDDQDDIRPLAVVVDVYREG